MGGRFAGKVAGIEFFDGSVDIVRVESGLCRDPIVGADLGDDELHCENSPYRVSLFG